MNCHHARQLISPYLDGQLTGREMLDLGDHLAGCESCRVEMQSLRQMKTLLRGLHTPAPRLEFSRQLSSQEILSGRASWPPALLPLRPQRGRRLAAALALSCVTLLAFAPASRDSQNNASNNAPYAPTSGFPAPSHLPLASQSTLSAPVPAGPAFRYEFADSPRRGFAAFSGPDIPDRDFLYGQPYSEQPYAPSLTVFQTVTLTQARPR